MGTIACGGSQSPVPSSRSTRTASETGNWQPGTENPDLNDGRLIIEWADSSVGESTSLTQKGSQVRVLFRPPRADLRFRLRLRRSRHAPTVRPSDPGPSPIGLSGAARSGPSSHAPGDHRPADLTPLGHSSSDAAPVQAHPHRRTECRRPPEAGAATRVRRRYGPQRDVDALHPGRRRRLRPTRRAGDHRRAGPNPIHQSPRGAAARPGADVVAERSPIPGRHDGRPGSGRRSVRRASACAGRPGAQPAAASAAGPGGNGRRQPSLPHRYQRSDRR